MKINNQKFKKITYQGTAYSNLVEEGVRQFLGTSTSTSEDGKITAEMLLFLKDSGVLVESLDESDKPLNS